MKILMRAAVLILVLFAALFFILVFANAVWGGSGLVPPQTAAVGQAVATSSLPTRFKIPSLGIDAAIQYVGVTASGNLGVPNNFTDVAWYKNGIVPGQAGSAVIDGHVDNALALPGVFKHLSSIKIGDSVYVQQKDGTQLHFVVYDIVTYPYTSVPMQTVFANTNAADLNIITCEGSWIESAKSYDHRIVVYTRLANS